MRQDRWDDDDFDDEELEEDYDEDEDAPSEVVPCSACGAEVYEDAEQCPACGEYIVHRSNPWSGKPWWWIILGVVGSAALIWFLIGQVMGG